MEAARVINPERNLRTVALRQHGVFTVAQAQACGFTRPVVRRRLACGMWEEVVPRVLRVAAAEPIGWTPSLMAAVLLTRGVAAGPTAAALYGWLPAPAVHHLAVRRRTRVALDAHLYVIELAAVDVTRVGSISVTAPARTLIDLAGTLVASRFEDVLDTAIVRRAVSPRLLMERATALRAPRRSGCGVVLAALAARNPEVVRASNEWEARTLRQVRELGLPDPRCNYRVQVGGRRRYLDLAWPDEKVAVEFDGFVPHSTRRVFDDDRARQNDLIAAGWQVYRLTTTAIAHDLPTAFAPIARFGRNPSRT